MWWPRWSAAAGRTTHRPGTRRGWRNNAQPVLRQPLLGGVGETRTSPRVRQRRPIEQRERDGNDQEKRFVERARDRCQPQRGKPTQRSWDALVCRGDPDRADRAPEEVAGASHAPSLGRHRWAGFVTKRRV